MRKDKPFDKSVYRSLTLVTQFGINMIVSIGMMTALGVFLDQKFETGFWTIILFFVGAIAGAQNVYHMAKKLYSTPSDNSLKETDILDEIERNAKKDKQNSS